MKKNLVEEFEEFEFDEDEVENLYEELYYKKGYDWSYFLNKYAKEIVKLKVERDACFIYFKFNEFNSLDEVKEAYKEYMAYRELKLNAFKPTKENDNCSVFPLIYADDWKFNLEEIIEKLKLTFSSAEIYFKKEVI